MVKEAQKHETYVGEVVPYDERFGPLGIVDDTDVSDVFVDRILNAATFEEAMQPPTTLGLRDLSGVECRFLDASGRRSTLEDSSGIYAIIDLVRLDTGERLQVTCGGKNVLALLVRAKVEDKFPFEGKVWETISQSDPRRKPLYIVPVDHF